MTRTAPPSPPAPSGGIREVELKLLVEPGDLPRVLALPALAGRAEGPAATTRLRTVYYDTPDLRLCGRGIALRLRHDGAGTVQGLKTMGDDTGDSAGIAVHREWEWRLAAPSPAAPSPVMATGPDFAALDAEGAGLLVPEDARAAIAALFETDVTRTTLPVRLDPLTVVEVAVDEGRIVAGARACPIAEIELELKSGRASRLFDLALALQRSVPLRVGTESKAQLGFRLVTGALPAPVLPEGLALSPLTTVAEAFRHIVRHGLRQVLANEPCALARGDAEGLHQIRVALRRLRTALALFEPVIAARGEAAAFRRELRWLAGRLTAARRWDVLLAAVSDSGDAALADAVRERRAAPLDSAVEAIRAPRCTTLVLGLAAWLEEGRWHAGADADALAALERPMASLSGPWLADLHARARKAGKRLAWTDSAGRERLRRRLRRLRYAVGFFRGLYPAAVRPYVGALDAVLAALDVLHDCGQGRKRLDTLDAPGAGKARARLARRADDQRAALPELWAAYKEAAAFWG